MAYPIVIRLDMSADISPLKIIKRYLFSARVSHDA